MQELPVAFVVSFLLGMRHATDADHVVAITTIIDRETTVWRSSRIGVLWGLGHTLTIFVLGLVVLFFKVAFTPRAGLSMELSVAVMLIVLGYLNLTRPVSAPTRVARLRPFAVGIVHGMAGSAAAMLLVLPLIQDSRLAAVYLLVFGIGTIAGMTAVTMMIAAPAIYAGDRVAGLHRGIRLASGALSLAFGAYLGYKIGFVDGLFTTPT